MTFQENVRATFYWKSFSKKASVVALATTFGTSLSIVSVPETSVPLAYVFLLFMVINVVVVFWMTTNPPVNLFRDTSEWWQLRQVWKPILLGVVIVLSGYVAVLVAFGFPLGTNSWQTNLRNILLFAAWVGFVEEFMRWAWLQVLPWGALTANLLWVLLHPEVAPILNGQAWNPFFAAFALTFGFLMSGLMWYGERNPWLGVVLAATLHAGYNALVIVWSVQVVVPGTGGQTSFGPMFAWPVALLGTFTVAYLLAMKRRRSARVLRRRAYFARRSV